ncbi:hypothetical protein [Deinococcus sp. Marseille-Q6407]|uniref:hypothetical protein n=1 Tax=Deinococcus sp. Marseille-Q6407 TaxID=2969223 RepID=UPI0021C22000|nr:hypothetical protein [Deinococcus sp. Marseille-Q6407]
MHWAGEVRARVLAVQQGRWQFQTLVWRPGTPSRATGNAPYLADVTGSGDDLRLTIAR